MEQMFFTERCIFFSFLAMSEFNFKLTLSCTHGSFYKMFYNGWLQKHRSQLTLLTQMTRWFLEKRLFLLVLWAESFGYFYISIKYWYIHTNVIQQSPLDTQLKSTSHLSHRLSETYWPWRSSKFSSNRIQRKQMSLCRELPK